MNTSVLKSIDVLMEFTRSAPTLSVTELSARLGLPKSTVHRILSTLQSRGFVEQLPNDRYALGKEIIALSQSVWVNVNVRDRVATVARSLSQQCSESVYVAVPDNDRILYIYAIETSQRLRARTAVGDRAAFHCTGIGKAMLAFLPDDQRKRLLDLMPMSGSTPNTVTDREALERSLQDIRERGFATDNEEHEVGTFCIGAPFYEAENRVAGAISISGRNPDLLAGLLSERSQMVVQAAQAISARLGYVESRPSFAHPSGD